MANETKNRNNGSSPKTITPANKQNNYKRTRAATLLISRLHRNSSIKSLRVLGLELQTKKKTYQWEGHFRLTDTFLRFSLCHSDRHCTPYRTRLVTSQFSLTLQQRNGFLFLRWTCWVNQHFAKQWSQKLPKASNRLTINALYSRYLNKQACFQTWKVIPFNNYVIRIGQRMLNGFV